MAEAAEAIETEAPEWVTGIEDEGVKEFASKFESQEAALKAIGYEPPEQKEVDWRELITDDDGKKFAEGSTDINHFVRRALDLRSKAAQPRIPGKDAKEEEIKAFQKAIGVPEGPDKYEFPEVPEDELTDEIKVSRETWGKRFHGLNVPNETAKELMKFVAEDAITMEKAEAEADKQFAKEQEEALKSEWKGPLYEQNRDIANKALNELAKRANVRVDDLTQIEMKDGRFLLDRPEFMKMFAALGREMGEGTLGPTLTEEESEGLEKEIEGIRKEIEEAQAQNNSKKANKLYARILALREKQVGNQPIVGAGGRTV